MTPARSRISGWPALMAGLVIVLSANTGCQHFTSLYCCALPQLPWRKTQPEPIPVSPPTYSTFVSSMFTNAPPQRVLMIEAGRSEGNYEPSQRLIAELASRIRMAGAFEVVTPPNIRLRAHTDNIVNGKFSEREIARLSRQYNADAVALVRVNELQGYAPMRASITMAIIDSRETVVVFAIDGNWNTANAQTQQAFARHVCSGSCAVPGSADVQLQSPTALLSFASAQITDVIGVAVR